MLVGILLLNLSFMLFFLLENISNKKQINFFVSILPLLFLVIFENGGVISIINMGLILPGFIFVGLMLVFFRAKVEFFDLLSLLWFSYFVGQHLSMIDIQVALLVYFFIVLSLVNKRRDFKYILGHMTSNLMFVIVLGIAVFIAEQSTFTFGTGKVELFYRNILLIYLGYGLGGVGRFKLIEKIEENILEANKKMIFYFLTYFVLPIFLAHQVKTKYTGHLIDNSYFIAAYFILLTMVLMVEYLRVKNHSRKIIDYLLSHHVLIGVYLYVFFNNTLTIWMLSCFLLFILIVKIMLNSFYTKISDTLRYGIIIFFAGAPLSPLFFIKYDFLNKLGVWNLNIICFGVFLYLPLLILPKILDVAVVRNEV